MPSCVHFVVQVFVSGAALIDFERVLVGCKACSMHEFLSIPAPEPSALLVCVCQCMQLL